jgi:hypothetical protein
VVAPWIVGAAAAYLGGLRSTGMQRCRADRACLVMVEADRDASCEVWENAGRSPGSRYSPKVVWMGVRGQILSIVR